MAKTKTQFVCQNCGTVHTRWAGKCDGCGEWNTIIEDDPMGGIGGGPGKMPKKGRAVALTTLSGETEEAPRVQTGISELDRVTGGGFVRGSAVLVGGDPGIGKSTLLMQAAAALSRGGHRIIYVSGEEAVAQVRLRAQRLGAANTDVLLAAETNVEDILATLADGKRPDLVIIDSIQTLWSDTADSAPGTVTQVRTGVQAMIRFAKQTGAAMVLVGHVTKEGQIAGPRVVEHMVDASSISRATAATTTASCAPSRTGSAPPTRSASSKCRTRACAKSRTRPNFSSASAMPRRRVPPFLPAWRARVRCWWRCRRWLPHLARHAAPGRRRLGFGQAFDDSCGAGGPLRRQAWPA